MSLLYEINDYLRRTAMPPTLFGRLAVKDPRLVGDLKRGRQPGPRMAARVRGFIQETRS